MLQDYLAELERHAAEEQARRQSVNPNATVPKFTSVGDA